MEHMGEIYFLYGYMLLLKKQQQNKTKQRNQQKNLLSCITFIYRIQMRSQKQLSVTTCKNKCQLWILTQESYHLHVQKKFY